MKLKVVEFTDGTYGVEESIGWWIFTEKYYLSVSGENWFSSPEFVYDCCRFETKKEAEIAMIRKTKAFNLGVKK